MRRGVAMAVTGALVLAGINAGAMIDALTYRQTVAQARALLPLNWRETATLAPEARLQILLASRSPAQAEATEALGAELQVSGGSVVLSLPVGLDTEYLDLNTGCFRFPRRQISLIVWHYYISTGCI